MLRFIPRSAHLEIRLFLRPQQDRHRLFVDRRNDIIWVGRVAD